MNKSFKLTDYEFTINKDIYLVTGTFFVCTDNYGADADGNRGVVTTFIDDFDIEKLEVNDTISYSMSGNELENILRYLEERLEKFI